MMKTIFKKCQEKWIETIERCDDWIMGDDDNEFGWYDD